MRTPDHWHAPASATARLLLPLSGLYALAGRLRARWTVPHRTSVPVICLGNVTAGGTGKTPLAITLSAMLREGGHAPFFLTRGYGGRLAGPVRVDARSMTAQDVGDEPMLLAAAAPTIVARDRRAGAEIAVRAGASVIVMDDGYQNPTLHKDMGILVADAGGGLGNGRLIPAGPLREAPETAMARAHALVVIGDGPGADDLVRIAGLRSVPVFRASLAPVGDVNHIRRKRLLAFAGIGRPEKFFESLRAAGGDLRDARAFPDHHPYTEKDATALLEAARAAALELVTTEKDMIRLAALRGKAVAALRAHTLTFRIEVRIDDADAIGRLIEGRLREALAAGVYRAFGGASRR